MHTCNAAWQETCFDSASAHDDCFSAVGEGKEVGGSAQQAGQAATDSTAEFAEEATERLKGQAQQAKQGGKGLMGWAYKTASNTVGMGLQLTEATVVGTARGVSRTAGSAVSAAGNAASRAGMLTWTFPDLSFWLSSTTFGVNFPSHSPLKGKLGLLH